ncbi:MAG: response regulator [Chloroflexi bacterium]|nr:response regulator [Chloroflexota bacterium]
MVEKSLLVMLISSDETVRRVVEHALSGSLEDYQLDVVGQPSLASLRAAELRPQVVIVDDYLDDTGPIELIRDVSRRLPDAIVLFLVETCPEAISAASQAVMAGAKGFLTKPLNARDLATHLGDLLGRDRAARNRTREGIEGHVIAFCSPKGGTGRTTMAINTAIGLQAVTKADVALIDADYVSPAIDVSLNIHTQHDVTDLLSRGSTLDEELVRSVMARHASGISALLAPSPDGSPERISAAHVHRLLALLKDLFGWIVVDVGLPLDETAFAFLDGAGLVVVSVLPELVGLRNARIMLEHLYTRGYPDHRIWVVVNRATMTGGISQRDIEQRLHLHVHHTFPDDQPLVTHSVNRGIPLIMSHRRGALVNAYNKFIDKLVKEMIPQGIETKESPASTVAGQGQTFDGRVRRPRLGFWPD